MADTWDHSVDVVVVGSGAGGMTAAVRAAELGLDVLLIEKSDKYGGTSAYSGGGIWIPRNDQIETLGGRDSFEEAWTYIRAASRGEVPEDKQRAYLEQAPRMLRWLHDKTRLRFIALPRYADYNQHLPGAKPGFRTMEPAFFDADLLGAELDNLRRPAGVFSVGGVALGQDEAKIALTKEPGWQLMMAKLFIRYWLDWPWRLKTKMDRKLKLGAALVAGLRRSMMDRNIPLWLNTPLRGLVSEGGRVTGVEATRDGKPMRIQARRGVVLAAGGFERNPEMRAKYLPQPTDVRWSATPPHNTGDAIQAGQAVGAAVDLMGYAWWAPAVHVPDQPEARGLYAERGMPGCVVVNRAGRRFVNEAADYNSFGWAMYGNPDENLPCWIVIDATFRQNYPCGPLFPAIVHPDSALPAAWEGVVYHKAGSLAELAAKAGIDPAGLEQTVRNMNEYARTGVDPEFQRGDNVYDRYYGNPGQKPNPNLGPIAKAPFYALPLVPGDIGTKGGLVTDVNGQVLTEAGQPIAGLYAAGNTTASVMGPGYPGPGSTLGPAMTFGYVAASHLAGVNDLAGRDAAAA